MTNLMSLTSAQLHRAAGLKDKISALEKQLAALIGSSVAAGNPITKATRKGKMSAAGRARIVAAQKARWAKIKGAKAAPMAPAKPGKPVAVARKKFKMSAAAKAKISAAAKARWAKVKGAKKA